MLAERIDGSQFDAAIDAYSRHRGATAPADTD
jgi:hypothetical protein